MPEQRERIATADQYYRVTEQSFRCLCPAASGHMNMGLWPAQTLQVAQERLIDVALTAARDVLGRQGDVGSKGLLDLGCGWGGSRRLFQRVFPTKPYFGVNSSETQVAAAREANAAIPHTHYIGANVEDRASLPWDEVDAVFSIEAGFHFENKLGLLEDAAAHGVRCLSFLEICVEDWTIVLDPLLRPSLKHAWSTAQYQAALAATGWSGVRMTELSVDVFAGFSSYLRALDELSYGGRRQLLNQLRQATARLEAAASRGDVRYLLLLAER